MQILHIHRRRRIGLRAAVKHILHIPQQPIFPLLDLVRVKIELLSQLGPCRETIVRSPFNAAKATFALNAAPWFRLVIVAPSVGIMPIRSGISTYPTCSDSPSHL